MTEIIEQNIFIQSDIFCLGPFFCFLAGLIFSDDDIAHVISENSRQNAE